MVSAVFHSPLDNSPPPRLAAVRSHDAVATELIAAHARPDSISTMNFLQKKADRQPRDFSFIWQRVLPPLLGLALLVLLWEAVSLGTKASIPSPKDTFIQAIDI